MININELWLIKCFILQHQGMELDGFHSLFYFILLFGGWDEQMWVEQ